MSQDEIHCVLFVKTNPVHCLRLIWCKFSPCLHRRELLASLSLFHTKPHRRTRHRGCFVHQSPQTSLPRRSVEVHYPGVSSVSRLRCNEWEFHHRCRPGLVGAREQEFVPTYECNDSDSDLRYYRRRPEQSHLQAPLEPSSLEGRGSCLRCTCLK